jgi:hypothetical protein
MNSDKLLFITTSIGCCTVVWEVGKASVGKKDYLICCVGKDTVKSEMKYFSNSTLLIATPNSMIMKEI